MNAVEKHGKKRKAKSSVYSFFLVSYTFILLISLSSCLVFSAEIGRQLRKKDSLSNQVLLSSLENDVDEKLRYVKELSNSMVFNQSLQFLVHHPSLASVHDAMSEMTGKVIPNDFLLDYFLYVRNGDEIVTSTIRMNAEQFFSIIYNFSDLPYETLRDDYLNEYHFQEYMPASGLRQYDDDTVLSVMPYLQSIPISSNGVPPGQLIMLLDCDKLFDQANALHNATGSEVYVLDVNDRLVYASPNAKELPQAVIQGGDDFVTYKATSYNCLFSEETGWSYYIAAPSNLYFANNRATILFLGAVFALYLLVGLVAVRHIAKRSYRPVKDINDLITAHAQTQHGKDEFDVIKSTLLNQMRSGNEMQQIIDAQRPAVVRDLLLQLLLGQTRNMDDAKAQLAQLGIVFGSDRFLCVLVEADLDSAFFLDSDASQESNLSVMRVVLQNVGCELLGESADCFHLDLARTQAVFLLALQAGADETQAMQQMHEKSAALVRFCANQFQLDLFVGVSTEKQQLSQISFCYDEARKALDYCRMQSGTQLLPVCFTDLNVMHSDYYYPLEMEQQLLQYIRVGNASAAEELLEHIWQGNFETKHISSAAARTLLYQLAATLQRMETGEALAKGGSTDLNDHTVEQVVNSSSIDAARRRLVKSIHQLALAHKSSPKSKTELLVERIVEYIDNCGKSEYPDLTALSEEFGVTPQYISNVFKKYRNENVKDYIAKHKLAQAKTMLMETDDSVREIAAQLGYAGEIGIIRLFRKYEKTTPGDYRAQHR